MNETSTPPDDAGLVARCVPTHVLISNSFAVPDVEPDEVIELDDARGIELFLYR